MNSERGGSGIAAELNVRLGNIADALTWFGQALRQPQLKQFPKWEQMVRDQWAVARESGAAAAAAGAGAVA